MPLNALLGSDEHRNDRDLAWWKEIRSGDGVAFEGLFRAYAGDLADFALSYVGDPDTAQDIVHTLFCWIWDRRHTLDTTRTVRAYLFSAVRNRARNEIRDGRTRNALLERLALVDPSSLIGTVAPTDSTAVTRDLEAVIGRAIAELPTRCREVFTLVRHHGHSYAEAAAILEIAPKTVEIHMARALKLLRARLAPGV